MIDLSYQEKSLLGSLAAVLVVAAYYFARTFAMLASGTVDSGEAIGLGIGAVALLVAVQITHHVLLALHCRPERADERDRLIAALATRNAYYVLMAGVWLVVGHLLASTLAREAGATRWFTPFATGQLLVLAAVAAEVAKYGSQLVYHRRGV